MESIYKRHNPGNTNGLYLKLGDGDKVKLRIVSAPAISVYKEGDKPRYSWIVWNRELKKPQVYSSGISVFRQIADLEDEWGAPTDFDITIKRTGLMMETEYSVVPVKASDDLTTEQQGEVDKINLPQAIKGKWLADYVEDGELPDPVSDAPPSTDPAPTDADAPSGYAKAKAVARKIDGKQELPEDMPPDFLEQ